jgi:hypothetical protein
VRIARLAVRNSRHWIFPDDSARPSKTARNRIWPPVLVLACEHQGRWLTSAKQNISHAISVIVFNLWRK